MNQGARKPRVARVVSECLITSFRDEASWPFRPPKRRRAGCSHALRRVLAERRDERPSSAGTSARRAQGGRGLEMEIDMREAQPTDVGTLIALDEIARVDPGRAGITRETVAGGGCLVAGHAGRHARGVGPSDRRAARARMGACRTTEDPASPPPWHRLASGAAAIGRRQQPGSEPRW